MIAVRRGGRRLFILGEETTMTEQITFEDSINNELTGDVQKNALNFADFLRANDVAPEWNDKHDGWNIAYKGKIIVFTKVIGDENVFAIIFNAFNFNGENQVDDELKKFVWTHLVTCLKVVAHRPFVK